ncbi:MAG: hypothetical protein H6Q21_300 [Bacteroidetes bacterium]|jgi:hypothetical protein|nr:hypothetical protein [Bacteroidota bacterium]MBS1233886.1 hypothetical protein [Bacteroidota bacterium]
MLIAQEKRKSNIAEYILYMWQVEDIIRACNFDISLIESNYVSKFRPSPRTQDELKDWYVNLILMMHEEGIREKGHLSFLNTLVREMNDLHLRLLNSRQEVQYQNIYTMAVVNLREFKSKLPASNISDVEACLDALYGLLLLRLKRKVIHKGTEEAMATFSRLLAYLSDKFHRMEKGELEL